MGKLIGGVWTDLRRDKRRQVRGKTRGKYETRRENWIKKTVIREKEYRRNDKYEGKDIESWRE